MVLDLRGKTMRVLLAAMSLAVFVFGSSAALADKRVAFVVGNAAYKNCLLYTSPSPRD